MEKDWQLDLLTIKDRISQLWERSHRTDVSFAIGDKLFHAHKAILSVASPVFDTMFYGNLPEKTDQAIKIDEIDSEAFSCMLQYVYTDAINIESIENAFHLCKIAKMYILNQLEKGCIEYLKNRLNTSNVFKIYNFAKFFELVDLKEKALKIIREQTISVVNSDEFADVDISDMITILEQDELQTTEVELFLTLENLAKSKGAIKEETCNNNENSNEMDKAEEMKLKTEFRKALKMIQFCSMTSEQFSNGPAFSKLILAEEAVAISACIIRPSKLETLYPKDFVKGLRKSKNLPHVFFEFSADGEPIGRIVMQLRPDVVPKTVERFLIYCNGENLKGFKGSHFFRINSSDCSVQAVDKSGNHVHDYLEKENFVLKNKMPGSVGVLMRKEKESQCASFFIAVDGNNKFSSNVFIGHVVQGMDVVDTIKTFRTDDELKPSKKVLIESCGEIKKSTHS